MNKIFIALALPIIAGIAVFHYSGWFDSINENKFEIADMRFIENHLVKTTMGGKKVDVLDRWVQMQDGRTLKWDEVNLFEIVFSGFSVDKNNFSDISVSAYLINEELRLADYDDWKKITNPKEWLERASINRVKKQIIDHYKLDKSNDKTYKLKAIEFKNKEKFEGRKNFIFRVVAKDNRSSQFDIEQIKLELK